MITSIHNPKIKLVRELISKHRSRDEHNVLICEGVRLVEEALSSRQEFVHVFVAEELFSARAKALVDSLIAQDIALDFVKADILNKVSDTETSQGIVAIIKRKPFPLPESPSMLFIPSEISDPGNMGTMLRTAWAAGVDLVIIPPNTVDVYSPKVVRSAMGAHFHLPLQQKPWAEIQQLLKGIPCYLAETEGDLPYDQVNYSQHFALIIGNEARGAGEEAQALATQRIFIPMAGDCESLNAAVAAGIILFEAVRQRRM